jgi:hypothetical protein
LHRILRLRHQSIAPDACSISPFDRPQTPLLAGRGIASRRQLPCPLNIQLALSGEC